MSAIRKYPRTRHLVGSRRQPGDEELTDVPWSRLAGQYLVVEEKLDGANAAISFAPDGSLRLQSRGHYLAGGCREAHFDLFKQWAGTHAAAFRSALGTRHVLYGEWLFAKHTVFYDRLPHYFLEFDVLDRATDEFLSTARRRELLAGLPVVSVPVLWSGVFGPGEGGRPEDLVGLVGRSLFKSPDWRDRLAESRGARGLDPDEHWHETDPSDLMEGLYIKLEEGGRVGDRVKWVRYDFLTRVLDSGTHWLRRPIVPNRLREGVDLFGGAT